MLQRPIGRSSCLIHLSSIILSIATAVIGIIILILKNPGHGLSLGSTIALIIGELLAVFSLPFLLLKSRSSLWVLIPLNIISSALSLGAGLSLINFLITSAPSSINTDPKWIISLLALFISSQFFHGLSISNYIHTFQNFRHMIAEEQDKDDIENLREKVISLKASAATLVESRKASGNQESVSRANNDDNINGKNDKDQLSSLFQSTKSRFNSKVSLGPSSENINKVYQPNLIQSYSIKKLSMINQSCSSTNISLAQSRHPSFVSNSDPADSSSKEAQIAKNLSLERDALRRIPSALLPPHLKPQPKQQLLSSQEQSLPPHSFSQPNLVLYKNHRSQSNLYNYGESVPSLRETIPESIPRAATFNNLFAASNTQHDNGIKTITPTDYEKSYEDFQFHQLRGPLEPSKRFQKSAHFGDFDPTDDEDELSVSQGDADNDMDEEAIEDDVVSDISNQSTEDALKFVQDAQEKGSNEFIRDVIDQPKSNLELERVRTPTTLTKSKSYSPHKSIFRGACHYRNHSTNNIHHGRKDSSTSISFKNFSMSMPSSPRKKSIMTSPKKLKIKNLSLSNIVFKPDDDDIPNLSYVHELQSSPSKKRRASMAICTPTKNFQNNNTSFSENKVLDNKIEDKSNSPESNWSDNSHKSVFPSEVIGEYDKEKWKTMERLQLVKQEDSHLEY